MGVEKAMVLVGGEAVGRRVATFCGYCALYGFSKDIVVRNKILHGRKLKCDEEEMIST